MFTNPTDKKPFPKLLLAGKSGTGKTAFCLSAGGADKPVAILDAEHGTDLMASGYLGPGGNVIKPNFRVMHTQSPADVIKALDFLERHAAEYSALAVDGGSVFWEMAQDSFLKVQRDGAMRVSLGAWNTVKLPVKRSYHRIMRAALPVILTTRAKDVYRNNEPTGEVQPDFEKGAEHAFDLVLMMERAGDKFRSVVYKSRMVEWPIGTVIPDPTWEKVVSPIAHRFDPAVQDADEGDELTIGSTLYSNTDTAQKVRDEILAAIERTRSVEGLRSAVKKYQETAQEIGYWSEIVQYARQLCIERGWPTKEQEPAPENKEPQA